MAERSRYDYASNDSNRLGLFYSAADWINKDIYNQFGGISLDDYFGELFIDGKIDDNFLYRNLGHTQARVRVEIKNNT